MRERERNRVKEKEIEGNGGGGGVGWSGRERGRERKIEREWRERSEWKVISLTVSTLHSLTHRFGVQECVVHPNEVIDTKVTGSAVVIVLQVK